MDAGGCRGCGSGQGVEEGEVLDLLSGLVEKSLVVARESQESGVRYRMLEPVRQYAREKLEKSGETPAAKRAHAGYFLALAEEAESELFGPRDVEWLERLEEEHDNIRATLSWALEEAQAELGLRLAGALWPFWEAHGHYSEARRWLEEALKKEGYTSGVVRAKALNAVGRIAIAQSYTHRAEVAAQEGIELSTEVEIGSSLVASFRRMLGNAAGWRGDYKGAKELAEESLTLSRQAHDKVMMAEALFELGGNLNYLGDPERGKELYEEGIALCREVGYVSGLGRGLLGLGYFLVLEGDYERGATLNALSAEQPSATTPSSTTSHSSLSSAPEHPAGLTSREIEVLGLVAAGMTSAQIAKELFVSPRTVEAHITSIYHKLGVSSRAAATRFALEHGLA
jgi:non-specific serine/threonine protein kinase